MKNKNVLITTLISMAILLSFIGTYAYFSFTNNNSKQEKVSLQSGNMSLIFNDGDNGINSSLNFGESIIKKFTIENTGSLAASVSLDWLDLINTYQNNSLTYKLSYSTLEDGEYTEITPKSNVPVSHKKLTQPLSSEISVPEHTTYYYQLEITLNHLDDIDQTSDLNANFQTQFKIGEVSKYIYYKLSINPNEGTWNEFTATQEYQLHKDDSFNIPDPIKIGYTFDGWEINGMSSNIENQTFTMGISDTELKAKWTVNKYTITIDTGTSRAEEYQIEYGTTIDLPKSLEREGYTFVGWEASGGIIEGNKYYVTSPNDVTITAKWVDNSYKYIVYHNKQNVDGNGYTLLEADTEEGIEIENKTIIPEVKSYKGFTSPKEQSLTIRKEEIYPPVLNKIEYNYERNKYSLTLDLNGGTSSDNLYFDMFYEEVKTLRVPTKTGYTFTNWTTTSGTMNNNTFKMDCSDTTIRANYTPKTYTVTFNANGGTTQTGSKIVTYDMTYGTLPTPTYEGHEFLGWFTSNKDGTEINADSEVKITNNQILYAHWEKIVFNAIEAVKAIKSGKTPENFNQEHPNFYNSAITDEGVFAMEDDYGISYYYRGDIDYNYVKFGDFYWRIIRINGNGSLRIIYDGPQAFANNSEDVRRVAFANSVPWNSDYGDAKYAGYMFGPSGKEASTSKSKAQKNIDSINAKIQLENWYQENIIRKNLDTNVEDSIFCNDRSTPGKNSTHYNSDTGLGYGNNITAYGAVARLVNRIDSGWTSNPKAFPSLKCPNKNDAFTKKDFLKGNASLNQKVGMITADEGTIAGAGWKQSINKNYYLYKGYEYLTMSPYNFSSGVSMFVIDTMGIIRYRIAFVPESIAPVINLTSTYVSNMVGDGTASNPYRASNVTP